MRHTKLLALTATIVVILGLLAPAASAIPVCTDGYMGGPPRAACVGRIFPEAESSQGYVQFTPDATGFAEFQHGIEYLADLYPRWVSVFTLQDHFNNRNAVSAGDDGVRSYEEVDRDLGDGRDIFVVKITDHRLPDKGKKPLFFSLSVHGNERGGLEGGLRTAEDLAMAAKDGGTISDGVDNYKTTTGTKPKFHEYEVKDVLAKEVVYLTSFNPDGWAVGDVTKVPSAPYERGNSLGTDLNRQMPTVGRINESRNPLQESEMKYGLKLMQEIAREAGGLMAYGADVHGELTSNAYVDIMYPAGEFDSLDHRTLMSIAERTKSNIDATLYEGIQDQIEDQTGGDSGEGPDPSSNIPTKPAHWATVWDTLGYTDTGFIGDYLATDLAVTGMDYEIFLNHTVPDKQWNVYLQENHINATRQIIKTAMAYALFQKKEFRDFELKTRGRAGYLT
ncbi:MAG TPA: M14 family zinc carboxypeptidase, partial [Actinomycetota bacterium]|nr:M14 family zinc carboxypeptidase [Actinomycetota bacterium]